MDLSWEYSAIKQESRVVTGWKYFWFVTRYAIIGKFHCDLPIKSKALFHIIRYIILVGIFMSIVFTLSEGNLAIMKAKGLLDWQGQPQGVSKMMKSINGTLE